MHLRPASVLLSVLGVIPAQANLIPGLSTVQTNIEDPLYFGRRGPAHPDGEIAIGYSYYLCNIGTVGLAWEGPFNGTVNGQPGLRPNHPCWAFMVVRESNGRMVQLNDDRTYIKHASSAANSSRCTSCQDPGTSTILGPHCSDAYGQSTNANRFWLGPKSELDPWLGVWQPVGSYFDRGDPDVGAPANLDQIRSLTSAQIAAITDDVKNRVALREADLLAPGSFYYYMHTIVKGEAVDLRPDNYGYRGMAPTWNGTTWTFADVGSYRSGSPLNAWQGATVATAHNGNDDGTFVVAVKVTGPQAGLYHYEYAVHNIDNSRGAATLRVPLCGSTTIANVGSRDIDGDPLSDWTWSRTAEELVFAAPANNALTYNQLFNFWFDCETAPVAGAVALDQALPGAGAPAVAVNAQVPGGSAIIADLGPGCGAPSPTLGFNGLPTLGNAAFELGVTSTSSASVFLFVSLFPDNHLLAPGCTQYLGGSPITHSLLITDLAGHAQTPLAIPSSTLFEGLPLHWQGLQLVVGGPVFGAATLSNGIKMRVSCR